MWFVVDRNAKRHVINTRRQLCLLFYLYGEVVKNNVEEEPIKVVLFLLILSMKSLNVGRHWTILPKM